METQPNGNAQSPSTRPKRPTHWFWRIIRLAVFCYLLVLFVMMFLEKSFIYFPTHYPDGDWQPQGITFEDAWFQSADGTQLHGWYVPHEDPRAVVLFCHGNGGNITHRAETLRVLHDCVGVTVLIFDYRGYGRSEGKPDEPGVLADARAGRTWLAQRAGVEEKDIVIMGRSLGGAVAVDLAAGEGARGLVLECTFSSLPEVAAYHYPWLPVKWVMRTRFDSISKIGNYHSPLLQTHGTADTIVPYRFGRSLFEAANEPKQFVTLEGMDHDEFLPTDYCETLIAFLDELPKP